MSVLIEKFENRKELDAFIRYSIRAFKNFMQIEQIGRKEKYGEKAKNWEKNQLRC